MQTAKTMKDNHKDLEEALEDNFLSETLDKFAVAYRANRTAIFPDIDAKPRIQEIADGKDKGLTKLDDLHAPLVRGAEKPGP